MIEASLLCRTSGIHHPTRTQNSLSRRALAAIGLLSTVWLVLALSVSSAFAQTGATGAILGTVTDQSGAVLPDATVMLTDRATNATVQTTTNSGGHYVFANVSPSTYDIKITKTGFETAVVRGQNVLVGQSLTEDVKLPIGAVTQEVTVETTGTELQTLNATVGNSVSGVALESLPSIGGDVSTFMTLQPGVAPGGQVGGTVSDQSTFQLDGGNNTSDMDGNQTVYTPSFGGDPTGGIVAGTGLRGGQTGNGVPTGVMPTPSDSIEEFKVNTANQTADFNSSAGAQVQVVTKRGTNNWHGTVYEYYLDNNFNANTWDNNLSGTPIPSYHYSRFGAAVGGPIIPKDILGGKTYFFANYQGFRWPNSVTEEMAVPSATMRNGTLILPDGKTQYNLASLDKRAAQDAGNGINPLIQQFWNKYEPMPNDPTCGILIRATQGYCDGTNVQGYKANMAIPQNDNFGVARIDHDFGAKWHFNTSYRYYKLTRATADQVDVGGFFPGDTLGTFSSLSNRPSVPWYYVAGVTTNITSNTTNDLHYSFLRNWWQWGTHNAPPQLAGLGGAIEPLGEISNPYQTAVLAPYNVNAQQVRTRFWDGKDHYLRDDVTMLHGNHLFTFGGAYQHNYNYHQRTDNGGGINFTTTYQLGDAAGTGNVSMTSMEPAAIAGNSQYDRWMAAMLGIVTESQVAYTRSGASLALNPPLTPAYDQSTIPYYNVYFSDSWHMKPTLTVTYGMGWTLEMPPTEANGKQVILVDSSDQPLQIDNYIAGRRRAALQGQVYNPQIGFSLIGNTANSPKYPYDPFYGAFSPRIAVAWNPHFGDSWLGKAFGGDKTVVRGGYGRIFGRLNGVNLVLVPLLSPGLIQAVQCLNVYMPNAVANTPNGSCNPSGAAPLTSANAFRIGVDGLTAPLNAAAPTLPQPAYPGFNFATAAAGTALDPHTRPNVVDSVDFTIQRQLTNKITVELGYIGRYIGHEFQPVDLNAVPYMMTLGGQNFAQAYANIETAMGCVASASACGNSTAGNSAANVMSRITPQPFLEAALSGTGYCNGFANCTQAVISNQFSNLSQQRVFNLWTALDKGGVGGGPICNKAAGCTNANGSTVNQGQQQTLPGFNFGCSMLTCGSFGPQGAQLSSGFSVNASGGIGNYNAGFVTLRMSDFHDVTLQQNFTYGKALGTGDVTQSSSSITEDDPFNLKEMYGPQTWDRKYIYNLFLVYQPSFYKNQQGMLGHLLGGWNFSPIFAAGSGGPLRCRTKAANAQAFGAGDGNNYTDIENCVFTSAYNTGSNSANFGVLGGTDPNGVAVAKGVAKTPSGVPAGINLFPNPVAVFDQVRDPILGIDQRDGGEGPVRGMPYWNMDLSIRKNIRLTERFSTEFQFLFLNVLNHNQFNDPTLNLGSLSSFGVINTQGNTPRQMEFGLRVNF